jgi:hypothetical protein
MKVYKTNRLFYGKWLYRIETKASGANLIKRWGLAETQAYCTGNNERRFGRQYNKADKDQLFKYSVAVAPFLDKDLQIRAEHNTINFYLNDSNLVTLLKSSVTEWIVSVTEPESTADVESLQSKSSLVLCNELPHGKFNYRVHMRYNMPVHQRESFLTWLKNYGDQLRPSKTTVRWLMGKSPYMQDPFVYVVDKSHLLMVSLFLSGNLKNTQEFVLRDSGK